MPRHKYSYAQQYCIKKAGLALQKSGSLWPGCRVGVAVSGGVDSFTLLKVLKIRKAITPFPFEIMALHCNPGFAPQDHATLCGWLANEGLAAHIEVFDFGPRAHTRENRKNSPCFLCAWHRRKILFDLCRRYKLTHLAFGHNADDMLATFLMNFCRNGLVDGMGLNESFFGGALRIIRPLLLVEKKYIRQAAKQWNLPVWKNACPSDGKTARSQAEEIVSAISAILPYSARSMTNALIRWRLKLDCDNQ